MNGVMGSLGIMDRILLSRIMKLLRSAVRSSAEQNSVVQSKRNKKVSFSVVFRSVNF
jgi:hypothetical protein